VRLGDEAAAIVEDLETVWRARLAQHAADTKRVPRKPRS